MSAYLPPEVKPGDYFIQKLFVDDLVVFTYGFFESRTPDGLFLGYVDHNAQVRLKGRVLERAQHEFVGIISKRAYDYARRQGWPNDEDGVSRILRYHERPHGFAGVLDRLRAAFSR